MNGIYVDTSAWVAMHNARDKYHARAVTGGLNRQTSLITTNYVLDETLTMLLMDVGFTHLWVSSVLLMFYSSKLC